MEAISGAILAVVDFMLYSFWFALLVFVIFMLYMTYVTIKTKEKVEVEETRKSAYKKYYKSLLYSAPLIAVIMISMYIDIV